MRYGKEERLLRLALMLAASHTGLTLDEMAVELGVDRRSVERLRDILIAIFPKMERWDDENRFRRWRLPASALIGIVAPRAEVIAAIENSARDYELRGNEDRAGLLREAFTALRIVMQPAARRRADPDVEGLMEAEGIAMRPGPRPLLTPGVLPTLRRAILGRQFIVVQYAGPDAKEPASRIVCPYGILYGGRGWLVGHVEGTAEMRLWRLDRIVSVDLLDRSFARSKDFSLSAYAEQSFGAFQEEPFDVELRFTPEAADDAARWLFHPSQSLARETDGSLTVRFRAGGALEMCCHLFTWGTAVTVIKPEGLRRQLAAMAGTVTAHHG